MSSQVSRLTPRLLLSCGVVGLIRAVLTSSIAVSRRVLVVHVPLT